jgi:hypothetical protein
MLTCSRATAVTVHARHAAAGLLLGMAIYAPATPLRAEGLVVGGCVGGRWSVNCVARWGAPGDPYVRQIPEPAGEVARAKATEREHRWQERCHPTISQDLLGVPRYRYAAPGCEFGVID